ncbi:MAG: hypothetical protein N2035_09060 [Chthoniobacterales bacterium]|nr:hypothetical protein [Chthoniobacterales bacterium]
MKSGLSFFKARSERLGGGSLEGMLRMQEKKAGGKEVPSWKFFPYWASAEGKRAFRISE